MQNNYKKLQKCLDDLAQAQYDFTRAGELMSNTISPVCTRVEEQKTLDNASDKAEKMVIQFVENGARLSYLRDFVSEWGFLIEIIDDEITNREFKKYLQG